MIHHGTLSVAFDKILGSENHLVFRLLLKILFHNAAKIIKKQQKPPEGDCPFCVQQEE